MKNKKIIYAAMGIMLGMISPAGSAVYMAENKAAAEIIENVFENETEETEDVFEEETEEISEAETEDDTVPTGAAAVIYDQLLRSREEQGELWSVAIENLTTGEISSYQASRVMQSASVIKVFIMGAVYDRICYPEKEEDHIVYNESYAGELRQLLESMIRVSNNESANAVIRLLGQGDAKAGEEVVNKFCEKYGYDQTHLGRLFLESNPTDDNYTSAGDCRQILSDIYNGKLVCEEASAKMLDILKGQEYRWKIPAGLPSGYSSANKTGEMPDGYGLGCIENDIAIVYAPEGDYVLTVLSNELGGRNQEAQTLIQKISTLSANLMSE